MLDSWPIRQLVGWTVGQLDAGHSGDVKLCENCHSERSEESRTAQNTDPSHSLRMTKSKNGAFSHNLTVLLSS